jgi:hypothetical protein
MLRADVQPVSLVADRKLQLRHVGSAPAPAMKRGALSQLGNGAGVIFPQDNDRPPRREKPVAPSDVTADPKVPSERPLDHVATDADTASNGR